MKTTYYEVLGVSRDAKLTDINRAYNRHKSEVQRDTAPPDLKRETLIKEAYETLADPERRAAYDASLVVPDRQRRSRARAVWIGGIGVLLAAAGLYYFRPGQTAGAVQAYRTPDDIAKDVAPSIGPVQSIDVSGNSAPVSTAFAIGEDTMVASCRGVSPSAQLLVRIPPRSIPARVTAVDEALGLCRLTVQGVGSRPLTLSHDPPKIGELVYAAKVQSSGNIALAPGKIARVVVDSAARVIESTPSGIGGVPLLDAQGRVLGVANDGSGRYVPVPVAWLEELSAPKRNEPPRETEAPASGAPATPGQPNAVPKSIEDIPPERREKLEKAFRPPPDAKEDWMK